MAEQLFFSRDSKLYIEFDSKLWEIPVLDGFSFSQSTNQSEISLSEMQGSDGLSRRGNRVFTDSLAPAEWSFSTYVRPYLDSQSSPEHHAVEEALWAVMAGADSYSAATVGGGLTQAALTGGGAGGTNATGGTAASQAIGLAGIATVNNVGAQDASRTAGTYNITLTAAQNSQTGAGASVQIVVNGSGAATVTVTNSGASAAYQAGDTITVSDSLLGGGGAADLTFDVATISNSFSSHIFPDGTYTINNATTGLGGSGPKAGSGTGEGFEFDIVSSGTTNTINIISAGTGFNGGETISLPAGTLGTGSSAITFTLSIHSASGTAANADGDLTVSGANFFRDVDADQNSPFGPAVAVPTATNQAINFAQSNRAVLGTCNLYFVMETSTTNPMVYKLTSAAFNEASIDFEVDGIATINWSGFAQNITDLQSQGKVSVVTSKTASATNGNVVLDNTDGFKLGIATATTLTPAMFAIDAGVGSTKTFIRNRLTQLLVSTTDTTAFPSANYSLTLTGGNITISNNISYLVPEELGAVNIPIEHVTGGRTVNGNFTCYLTLDTDASTTVFKGTSVELFNDMTTSGSNKGLEKVVNDFDVTFQIGGAVVSTPRLFVKIPKCHIDVPTHSVEDVISVETNFAAYTTDFNVANEVQLEYYGIAL